MPFVVNLKLVRLPSRLVQFYFACTQQSHLFFKGLLALLHMRLFCTKGCQFVFRVDNGTSGGQALRFSKSLMKLILLGQSKYKA